MESEKPVERSLLIVHVRIDEYLNRNSRHESKEESVCRGHIEVNKVGLVGFDC